MIRNGSVQLLPESSSEFSSSNGQRVVVAGLFDLAVPCLPRTERLDSLRESNILGRQ